MAPRSAKIKKAADVKVTEVEAPKKGRGKTKNVEELEQESAEQDINEKNILTGDKKSKRGKKVTNDTNGQEVNEAAEDGVPSAKKGRGKKNEDPQNDKSDSKNHEKSPIPEKMEINGVIEAEKAQKLTGNGRKKQAKKDILEKPKETARGKKTMRQEDTESEQITEKEEINEEKPKSVGKGKGRKAQPKPEKEAEPEDKMEVIEEVKADPPAARGRKKGIKTGKEKAVESDKEDLDDPKEEDTPAEEVKKETKGRKNQGKTVTSKDVTEVDEDVQNIKKRKATKKPVGKGDSKDEDAEEASYPKPVKGKRGQKKVEAADPDEGSLESEEPTSKRRRKPAEEKADTKKKAPLKNKALTDYESIDFSNNSKNSKGKDWNFKISSWNVDGIRAWLGKGGLDYLKYEKPDILCLQEIKCSQDKFPEEIANLPGYHPYWLSGDKDGYAGVGIYTTKLAMNVQYGLQNEELDSEGRIITAEYEQFYLICTYVPNAGRKLVTLPKRLQWNEEFRKYVKDLDRKKPVIICGDMNVAHNEIDLANPKTNRKNAGFTEEERAGMTELLGEGFVDTYRQLYPETEGAYTFWTYMMNSRAKNVGWRLDYFIVSERLLPCVCDNAIRDQVYGSDHCPITLFLHLTSADKPKE